MRVTRFSRNESAAASIEAMLILPCFLLLFFAVFGIHARYEAKQTALAVARNCAWRYSQQGCAGAPPKGCFTRPSQPDLTSQRYVESTFYDPDSRKRQAARLSNTIENELGEPQRTLFGRYINAGARIPTTTPSLLDWEQSDTTAKYHLACNLEPQRLRDILGFLWDAVQ